MCFFGEYLNFNIIVPLDLNVGYEKCMAFLFTCKGTWKEIELTMYLALSKIFVTVCTGTYLVVKSF